MKPPFARFNWTRSRLVGLACATFLLGLWASRFGVATNWQLIVANFIVLIAVLKNKKVLFLVLALFFLNIGLARGQSVVSSYIPLMSELNKKVVIVGTVAEDASITDRKQIEFRVTNLYISKPNEQVPSGGRIKVRGFPKTKINRNDVIRVEGRLRPSLGNQQGQIYYAQISLVARNQSYIERLRSKFIAGTYNALPEVQASLGLGLLVGTRSLLPSSLEDALVITGLMHIVAVSGYNLTILVRFARRVFSRSSKYLATAISFALIFSFLAVTGLSPSVMRAAIVSTIALLAWYYGRTIKASILLLVSAVITAGLNPSYLWFDIGWYLSFLAFYGVLILAPTISARLFPKKSPGALWQLTIETFCAQIMTLPLILFIFSRVSIISFVANLIVLPLVPLAMLLTFLAGLSGMLLPVYSGWIGWPARWLLHFNVFSIEKLSQISWASQQLVLLPWQLITMYGIIFSVQIIMYIKVKKVKFDKNIKNNYFDFV